MADRYFQTSQLYDQKDLPNASPLLIYDEELFLQTRNNLRLYWPDLCPVNILESGERAYP